MYKQTLESAFKTGPSNYTYIRYYKTGAHYKKHSRLTYIIKQSYDPDFFERNGSPTLATLARTHPRPYRISIGAATSV